MTSTLSPSSSILRYFKIIAQHWGFHFSDQHQMYFDFYTLWNTQPCTLFSQLQYPDMETIRLHRHTSPAFHRPLGSSPPPHSLHTLLPPPQAFPSLQEVRYSSPETPPGSTPSPGSAYSSLPPAPLHLTSLEVTATELVWRGGALHQQDQVNYLHNFKQVLIWICHECMHCNMLHVSKECKSLARS